MAWDFPQHLINFRPSLAQFEIGETHFVCEHAGHKRAEQNQEEKRVSFHFLAATLSFHETFSLNDL